MEFALNNPAHAAGERPAGDWPAASADATSLRALFHDVANHLLTFSCLLDAVDADTGLSAATRAQVSMMRNQTERILALLKDSVDHRMRPALVEVHGLVREVASVANARRLAPVTVCSWHDGDGASGDTAYGDAAYGGERWLRTYPAALWRVVANIVDNAIRAAGRTGQVAVRVHDEPRRTRIEVVDNGPGFGNSPPGTAALGLHIAANLADRCEGKVMVLPAAPQGVRVLLEFPDLTGGGAGTEESSDERCGEWT